MSNLLKINLGFAFAIMTLLIVGTLSYLKILGLADASQARTYHRQSLVLIFDTLSTLKDAETGQRGFLLTGKKNYLTPYKVAKTQLTNKLSELRRFLEKDPNQLSRLSLAEPIIIKKMNELEATIKLREEKGFKEALEIVNSDQGINAMSEIRTLFDSMALESENELTATIISQQESLKNVMFTSVLGCIIALSLVLMSIYLVNRDHKQREQLKSERDQFFTSSLDMLGIATMSGSFTSINPAFSEVLGYSGAEFCSQSFMNFVHPDDVPITIKQMEGLAKGINVISFENRYRCKDGSFKWLSWKSTRHGNLLYAAARDVTQAKAGEKELIAAREKALEAARIKAEFLANMSHEIRTPLNGIIGMNDLLLETNLQDQQRKYAKIVQESGYSLLNIINDILDFSKIEAGKFDLEETDFGIHTLVEGQADLLAAKAREKEISLMTFIDPKIPQFLRGDSGRIGQVLLNFLSNAIKFTTKGRVVISVDLEASISDTFTLRFSVQDSGCGISASDQNKLFQPFTQADGSTARKYGGTGLGLSISKKLVELMDGEVGLKSELNQGSKFWFTIPLRLGHTEAVRTSIAQQTDGLKALIVDDDHPSGEIIATYARSWNITTTHVESGSDALAALRHAYEVGAPFDLAIVDLRMPNMNGLEVAKQINLDEKIKNIRLILVTAFDQPGQWGETKHAGFSAYLTKPVKQSELYDAIVNSSRPTDKDKPNNAVIFDKDTNSEYNGRVLVAEDNSVNQLLVLTLLKNLGYNAHCVGNGLEVLKALNLSTYDLVLMDCQMPEMDGYEATRAIRKQEGSGPRIPIIALTANALKEDEAKCLQSGMDDYISKPVKKDTLARVLERWSGRSRRAG
jgi:PAS domain S-box-containing protein